jgi:hypothetical protein
MSDSPSAILLRESCREGRKVPERTLCDLFRRDPAHIEGLRAILKGGTVIGPGKDAFTIARSPRHGHAALALSQISLPACSG